MIILTCSDPQESSKENMHAQLVWALEESKAHRVELFNGFHPGTNNLITKASVAAEAMWRLIQQHNAEGLVMDVRGFEGTEDTKYFWLNAYECLLKIPRFKEHKRRLNVVFWSRYLDDEVYRRLWDLDVPRGNILDRNNSTPRHVLRRLLLEDR
jgi:hypothetical protein